MSQENTITKARPYTTTEVAFIIGYTDYCNHHGVDYKKTVVDEMGKITKKTVSYGGLIRKLSRLLESYSVSNPSMNKFKRQGTGYLNISAIPSDVRAEIDRMRLEWGFLPLGVELQHRRNLHLLSLGADPL
jgi:hypothetical protein